MTVRRAVLGDELVLRTLRLQALSDAPSAFASTYERELARTPGDWRRWLAPNPTFLLYDAEGPKGLVAGVRDAADPAIVWLMAMWVDAALRGSGGADALVAAVVAWAAEIGAREVKLNIAHGNDRARKCYERHGFAVTGRENVRETDGFVEIEMSRPVDL
jgi:GNAT superfamily N-acetyltransferase